MVRTHSPAALWLVVMLAGSVRATDHPPREVAPYALQPPGASFERTVARKQWIRLVHDDLRDTVHEMIHEPVRSLVIGSDRLAERVAARIAGCVPHASMPGISPSPVAGGPLTPARLTPLYDSKPAYQALLELIASAQCRIDFMIFGWGDDEAGRPVAAALIEKARAGVLVRVMIDWGGFVIGETNAHVVEGCPSFVDALKAEPNVHLIEATDPAFRFDHRKIAVIDDRIVWTGSMILTRPSLDRWHNFNFLAEGPIVPQYAALFADRWERLGGCWAPTCPQAASVESPPFNAMVRLVRTDVDPP
jgi:phosphatidylserine/phosphatidylglycerophosphate/cardiolipin synthase-like enzyme